MNEKRKFNCKAEDVPAVAGYLIQRVQADLSDFTGITDAFADPFLTQFQAKTTECNQLVVSDVLTQEIKTITRQITEKSKTLRLSLNKMDVYFGMADGQMTVDADAMGTKKIRTSISGGNTEGIVANTRRLMQGVSSNMEVLQTKGLKPALVASITALTDEIETLGNDQNFKTTERNRHTDENIGIYNELWDMVAQTLQTGRAIYRGVDATKLNDYTLTSILKRLNAEGGAAAPKAEAPKA